MTFLIDTEETDPTNVCCRRSRQDSQSSGRPQSAGRSGPSPGQPIGFHRGGRGGNSMRGGGGGFGYGQSQVTHGQQGAAVRGRGGRGGFQPGRPQPGKKETLKFEQEFDFEQANEQFKGIIDKLGKTKLDDNTAEIPMPGEPQEENGEDVEVDVLEGGEDGEIQDVDEEEEVFYDKQKSFFDNISCEALERSKGKMVRNDWKAEKKLNKETFGVAGNRRYGFGGRGGYHQSRGGRGGYHQARGGGGGFGRIGGPGGGNFGRGGGQFGQAQRGNYGSYNRGGGFGGRGFGGGVMAGGDRMDRMGQRGGYAAAVRGGANNQGQFWPSYSSCSLRFI